MTVSLSLGHPEPLPGVAPHEPPPFEPSLAVGAAQAEAVPSPREASPHRQMAHRPVAATEANSPERVLAQDAAMQFRHKQVADQLQDRQLHQTSKSEFPT